MANVKFPRSTLEKEIKLTPNVIDKINLFGVPIEKISEKEVDAEILPNRPDLLSVHGFIRSLKTFLGMEKGIRKYKVNKPEKDYRVKIDSAVKAVRPYTACAIVRNIKFSDENIKDIIELQEKLHSTIGRNRKKLAIGIYPLDKIKLPITYTALSPEKINFIPLGVEKEMSAYQIIQRHQTGKDYGHLLEGLSKYPVFIDAKDRILSMPPIVNSEETGKITSETKDVFVECSGMDFPLLTKILNIVATALSDMGGDIYSVELDYGKERHILPDLTPEKIKISLANTNNLLGLNLNEKDLTKLLEKMGYNFKGRHAEVPQWRVDILHEVDIIEDIAIAYGYNEFVPDVPRVSYIGEESQESKMKSVVSEILVGLGLTEVSSFHLVKKDELAKMKIDDAIELADSKTDYKFLRNNLITSALRILSENKDADYPQRIFEIGRVFFKDENAGETGVAEQENLIITLTPGNFTDAKQNFSYLAKMLDFDYKLNEAENKQLIEGRTASILVNDKVVGYMGEVHPKILNAWNIKMPVSVMEISVKDVFKMWR